METLLKLVLQHWPSITTAAIVGILVWMAAKFYFKRFVVMERKINDAPCDKHDKGFRDIGIIKASVRKIEDYILRKDTDSVDFLMRKCSPYKLTDAGDALLNVSGGKECIDDNIDFFDEEIQKLNPQVALDVESYSLHVLNSNTDKSFFNQIKDFVYNAASPYIIIDKEGNKTEFEGNLTMNHVLMVMGVYLRNRYFERHEGFVKS